MSIKDSDFCCDKSGDYGVEIVRTRLANKRQHTEVTCCVCGLHRVHHSYAFTANDHNRFALTDWKNQLAKL